MKWLIGSVLLLFLSGCGGSSSSEKNASQVDQHIPISGCENSEVITSLECLQGEYELHQQYMGTPVSWQTVRIGAEVVWFDGEISHSILGHTIQYIDDQRRTSQQVVVAFRGETDIELMYWVFSEDGRTVLAVEYDDVGVSLQPLQPRVHNVNTGVNLINAKVLGHTSNAQLDMSRSGIIDHTLMLFAADDWQQRWQIALPNLSSSHIAHNQGYLTYRCDQLVDSPRITWIDSQGNSYDTDRLKRCEITLFVARASNAGVEQEVIDYIDGWFTAELQQEPPQRPLRITNGLFRIDIE